MDLLHPVVKKWEDIAKALNIDEDRVDEIFTNNENEYLRLYELMEYYFTNVHCSHSWEEMVRVLTEIGEHGLAERIKADKIQGVCLVLVRMSGIAFLSMIAHNLPHLHPAPMYLRGESL